jgi:chaperone modulatory protein CbpM
VTVATDKLHEFLRHERLDATVLRMWIAQGWLSPPPPSDEHSFSEVDLARAQLIRDLQRMGVNDDGIPIILDLVDQLHGLRHALREIMALSADRQL